MAFNREQLLLYAVTDRSGTQNMPFLSQIEEALRRRNAFAAEEKNMEEQAFIDEAVRCSSAAAGVPLIINDNVQVAHQRSPRRTRGASDQPVGRSAGWRAGVSSAPPPDVGRQLAVGRIIWAWARCSPQQKDAVRITAQQLRESEAVSIRRWLSAGLPRKPGPAQGGGIAGIGGIRRGIAISVRRRPPCKMARELVGR
ncbi:MAG: thiamine phosphate synthase [Oscillospiraceae bacterium]